MGVTNLGSIRTLPGIKIELDQTWLRRRHWSPFNWLLVGSAGLVSALILLVPAYLLLRHGKPLPRHERWKY